MYSEPSDPSTVQKCLLVSRHMRNTVLGPMGRLGSPSRAGVGGAYEARQTQLRSMIQFRTLGSVSVGESERPRDWERRPEVGFGTSLGDWVEFLQPF